MAKQTRNRNSQLREWPKLPPFSSVKGRIIIGFGLLVFILVGVAAGSAWQVREHQSDLAEMEERAATASLLQDVQLNVNLAAAALQRYVIVGDEGQAAGDEILLPEIRSSVAAAVDELGQALAQEEMRGDEEQIARLNEISAQAASLSIAVGQVIALRQSGGVEAMATLEAMVLPFREFRDALDEAAEVEFQQVSALRSQSDRAGDLAFWLLVISGAAGAALAVAASALIARSILGPLSSLESGALVVSGGDLKARVPAAGPRELAHLGATLNSMISTVEQRTDELRLANEELRERNRQLLDARAQAATDALTGLSNHRTFHERAKEEVRRAQETGSPIGFIMLDIDDFKRFNDSLGHLAGDEILRGVAHTLADVAPREDAYRYGGDEFAVLLPGADHRKTTRLAERLCRAVERCTDGHCEKVTVSLGVASFPDTAASAEELIYGADAAMYWAKSAGKNRVGDWSKLTTHKVDGTLPWYAADRAVRAPDVVAALVAALAAKDPTTSAHTERCSWYTAKLAGELGLGEKDTSIVRLASLLHDIGKLAVPDDVLFKPGPLNDEEWAQMKQHSTAALHVLSQVRSVSDATPAILHHHEHFDGSGYPDGLAGDDIPVASRILLVTDAFDAMTTDRPYRKAMPVETAIEELKRCSGSQFDPVVVDAFLRILSREGTHLPCGKVDTTAHSMVAGGDGSRRTEQ